MLIDKYKLKSNEDFFSISVCSGVKIPNFYSSGHDSIRLSQMIECEELKEEKMRLESQEKKLTDLEIWEKSKAINKNRFLLFNTVISKIISV